MHTGRDGDGCFGDGDDGDGDDDDVGDSGGVVGKSKAVSSSTPEGLVGDQKKHKSKKKKSKKSKKQRNAVLEQSSPPRVPLTNLFPSGEYPKGELQSYAFSDVSPARTSPAEIRQDGLKYWEDATFLETYRKAAEVHRQTRAWLQDTAKPGQKLHDIAQGIEDSVRALLDNAGLEPGDWRRSGLAFPTGLCLNHQVAHYTPNPGQKAVVLQHEDVLTIDFGVHINGWIVDSALTLTFDHTYDNLLAAVKDATNTGIKVCADHGISKIDKISRLMRFARLLVSTSA